MTYEVLGFPEDEPTLTLDWEAFSYAGKFEMGSTGKAVLKVDDEIVAAAAFSGDRTTSEQAWIRYLTVKKTQQGDELGPRLAVRVTETLLERGFERVTIAVNNPLAYRALYKAGFSFTGRETGIAELVLAYPGDRDPAAYRAGLATFADRDLPARQAVLTERWLETGRPPATVNGTSLVPSPESETDGARRS